MQEASTSYNIQPPTLGHGEKKIKVADGYVEYEIIPAQFEEVTETVEVERERIEIVTEAATYRTETKRVKTKDASQRWNPNCPPVQAVENAPAPEHCLITVPAEYQEVTRKVITTPARTYKKVIPARMEEVTRKVMISPARIVRHEVPPRYISIPLEKVEQPAKILTEQIAEHVEDIAIQKKIRPERFLNQPALCEDALDSADIMRLQQILQGLGYYQGAVNGTMNTQIRAALTRYQEDHNLATGALTVETAQKLSL